MNTSWKEAYRQQPMTDMERLWLVYADACDARYEHVWGYQACLQCWPTGNDCLTWNILTAEIERTMDAWVNAQ